MKDTRPQIGPIHAYLALIPPDEEEKALANIRVLFSYPEGAKVMELLEKAILHYTPPSNAPEGALEDNRAQALLVHDLKWTWNRTAYYDRTSFDAGRANE
jgi:hypothetical protein